MWEALNGPEGGWVNAFYEHPLTHDIYAGLRFGGLWKSTDSGMSWQYVALASGGQNFEVTGNERGDIFVPRGGIGRSLCAFNGSGHNVDGGIRNRRGLCNGVGFDSDLRDNTRHLPVYGLR